MKTIQEAAAGATQNQLIEALKAKGKNPDYYEVYPFAEKPYLKNKTTGEEIIIQDLVHNT